MRVARTIILRRVKLFISKVMIFKKTIKAASAALLFLRRLETTRSHRIHTGETTVSQTEKHKFVHKLLQVQKDINITK